jgi:hypothetical protein
MVMQAPGFTPPPSLAQELRGKSAREQLDEYGTPGYKRLQIPLVDANSLATTAEILTDLAYQLRLQSRAPTGREIDSLRAAFWEINAANRRLSAIQKIRRPTKSGV